MSKRIRIIDQLDSIRAFAAFSVIIYHFLPHFHIGKFDMGWVGVDVFFVISGYLITAILLEQKENISNKFLIIKNFIVKRALRLFPTYYSIVILFLILSLVFGLYVWRDGNAIFYFTYTQNLLVFFDGGQGVQVNHLWTLAVEEQFYLVWPWLLIFISNKWLIRALIVVIPFTIIFKSVSELELIRMLTFVHFDTLGGGALVALLLKEKGDNIFKSYIKWNDLVVLVGLGGLIAGSKLNECYFTNVLAALALSIGLLIGCYYQFTGWFGKVLNLSSLKYLGKISYGLYLFHQPVLYFLKLFVHKAHLQINPFILFFIAILATIIIAHLSYNYFEKRFLKLKNNFDL